jgi:hypothetical protein
MRRFTKGPMPTFVVERELHGAGTLSGADIQGTAQKSVRRMIDPTTGGA